MREANTHERNMRMAEMTDGRSLTSDLLRYSSADSSERKSPMAMENASTSAYTTPVSTMVSVGTPATLMPARKPTVETRLSFMPKIMERRYIAEVFILT